MASQKLEQNNAALNSHDYLLRKKVEPEPHSKKVFQKQTGAYIT